MMITVKLVSIAIKLVLKRQDFCMVLTILKELHRQKCLTNRN